MAAKVTNEPANYFALGKQSAKDSAATTFHFLKHLDGTELELDVDAEAEREGGDGQEVGLHYKRTAKLDGQANANARAETAARFLAWALGDQAAGASFVATGVQRHEFFPAASLPYLTAEQRYSDQIERGLNTKLTGLTFEGESGRPIKLTAGLVGGGTFSRRETASALTPARESGQPFFYPRGSYVIDGTGDSKLTKFKIEVKRGVDDDIYTTDIFREDVVELNFDADCEFTLRYEDKALYDKIHYGSGSTVPIEIATGSFNFSSKFGSGTNTRELEVFLPQIDYTGAKVNKLDPDGKTVYIDLAGMTVKAATHSVIGKVTLASQADFV